MLGSAPSPSRYIYGVTVSTSTENSVPCADQYYANQIFFLTSLVFVKDCDGGGCQVVKVMLQWMRLTVESILSPMTKSSVV